MNLFLLVPIILPGPIEYTLNGFPNAQNAQTRLNPLL